MKGQTVHKYPMHQLLMVYHGDNGLEALSSSSPPNQDSCEKNLRTTSISTLVFPAEFLIVLPAKV